MVKLPLSQVFRALPPATLPIVEAIVEGAERRGVSVYLVGGPVRDILLGRSIADVDLIIETKPECSAAQLAQDAAPDGARVRTHDRFGTLSISTPDASVDLAAVRRESYRHPGALPKVELGTLAEDLHRRDFSVNAMAVCLSHSQGNPRARDVEVIDPEAGLADLERRRLRILHPRSFHDDPTRALRAARLAPRLGFSLSRSSLSALRDALRDGAFGAVSGDRIRREIEKLFEDAQRGLDPAAALRKLADWHVLGALEPGLKLPREAVAPLRRFGRMTVSPAWRGPRFRSWAAGLAIWLTPLVPAERRRVLDRLSVRGELSRRLREFPTRLDALLEPIANARGRGAVDALLSEIGEEELYALHAWAPTPVRRRIVRWAAEDRLRRVPVSGLELADLGVQGPAIGRSLSRIRSAYLDGAVANREEALALAAELARSSKARRRAKPKPRRPAKAGGRTRKPAGRAPERKSRPPREQ
jgi:tRNA nucleotidyltransferase (CCA-adding enzyme)